MVVTTTMMTITITMRAFLKGNKIPENRWPSQSVSHLNGYTMKAAAFKAAATTFTELALSDPMITIETEQCVANVSQLV